jgi:hypothetical protein
VPITTCKVFKAVDHTLCDIRGKACEDLLFGGISFILGGDFAQTLPVVKHGRCADIVAAILQKSFIWEKLKKIGLYENMWLQGGSINADFSSWLGRMSFNLVLQGEIELPPFIQRAFSVKDLCEKVYPATAMAEINAESDFFASRAILAVHNTDLSPYNTKLLEQLPGELQTFYSVDLANTDDIQEGREEFTLEFLQGIELPGFSLSILQLKIGAPIMLLRNL